MYICTDCIIGGIVGSWSLCYCQTSGLMTYYDPFPYWNNPTTDTIDKIIAEYEDLNRHPIPSRGEIRHGAQLRALLQVRAEQR